jgi:hypothetical protein
MQRLVLVLIAAAGLSPAVQAQDSPGPLWMGASFGTHGAGVNATIGLPRAALDLGYEGTLPSTRAVAFAGLQVRPLLGDQVLLFLQPGIGVVRCLNDLNFVRCQETTWHRQLTMSGGVGMYLNAAKSWIVVVNSGYVWSSEHQATLNHLYGGLRIMRSLTADR